MSKLFINSKTGGRKGTGDLFKETKADAQKIRYWADARAINTSQSLDLGLGLMTGYKTRASVQLKLRENPNRPSKSLCPWLAPPPCLLFAPKLSSRTSHPRALLIVCVKQAGRFFRTPQAPHYQGQTGANLLDQVNLGTVDLYGTLQNADVVIQRIFERVNFNDD